MMVIFFFSYILRKSEENIMHNMHNKKFDIASTINIQSIQIEEEIFRCSVCSKIFRHKSKLDLHFRIHTGIKPYKCTICKKEFNQKSNLKSHTVTHTGIKTFQCHICGTVFAKKWNLRKHIQLIHFKEKPPLKCDVCDQEFNKNLNLKQHMLIHTGVFKCDDCNKEFIKEWNLKKHKAKIHTNEKHISNN